MGTCKKNILLIFGSLLIIAVLFVPYNSTHVTVKDKSSPYSGIKLRTTARKSGYMFLPQLFKKKAMKSSYREVTWDTYHLNTKLLIIEIAVIIFLGCFDYLFFCLLLRKTGKKREKTRE